MSERILIERDGPVATVTLNKPEKRNALTTGTWERLSEVMRELSATDDLRCIVLRETGDEAFARGPSPQRSRKLGLRFSSKAASASR